MTPAMDWRSEFFCSERVGRYPVRVYRDPDSGEATWCVCPATIGGALDGTLAQGQTLQVALERLTALLPFSLHSRREVIPGTPRPLPTPAVTMDDFYLREAPR